MISVIIPAYNGELFIERCLESVFWQSYSNIEVIVINDGSTDNTETILNKYAERIRYVYHSNRGPSAARNQGLKLAEGEFVAFLDADDYWHPEFLQRCLDFLERYPEADAVSTGQRIIDWRGKIIINPPCIKNSKEQCQAQIISDFFAFWGHQNHLRTGTCLLRRQFVERAGYFREDLRLAEDLEYWGFLACFGTWGFIPEILWVGDSARYTGVSGWLKKLKTRSNVVPCVEDWQKRILTRLGPKDFEGFRLVRGRVAQTFAYAKLLGGDIQGARDITQRYGDDFPDNRVSRLFRQLASKDLTIWRGLALALYWREACKDFYLRKKIFKLSKASNNSALIAYPK